MISSLPALTCHEFNPGLEVDGCVWITAEASSLGAGLELEVNGLLVYLEDREPVVRIVNSSDTISTDPARLD